MKYISANKISDFVFHDAVFELTSFKNNDLTVSAQLLNIHKTAEQNPFDADMEKLSRSYTDICENFEAQTKEHYTYNDFLYQLENNRN